MTEDWKFWVPSPLGRMLRRVSHYVLIFNWIANQVALENKYHDGIPKK